MQSGRQQQEPTEATPARLKAAFERRRNPPPSGGGGCQTRTDLGNTLARDGDGRLWKGRGLGQLTGARNYQRYAAYKGRPDILSNPSVVASDPDLCCDTAGWYWQEHHLNRWADHDNLEAVTRRINGGLNGLRDRHRLLDIAKSVLIPNDDSPRSVAALQRALNRLSGADLSVDGVMGRLTRAAVMQFQGRHGLTIDGVAGPQTWARINDLLTARSG